LREDLAFRLTGTPAQIPEPGSLALLLLAGCATVGPDYLAPTTDWDSGWTSPALDAIGRTPDGRDWWSRFDDPALDALVAAAITGNRDFKVAGLRVLEARAQQAAARANRSPQQVQATASAGYAASKPDGATLGQSDFLFGEAGVTVGWEIDFWGKFKRGIESADAAYFASLANRADFALILRAEVARLYLQHRTLEERLEVVRGNVALQKRSVAITERLFREGAAGELDWQQARTQYLSTLAAEPGLEAAIHQTRNGLALLLGRPPGPLPELALSPARLPTIPPGLQSEIPADLLRRRPDVRAAGLRAAAQSAQIGIAKSALYPSLVLGGSLGVTRTSFGGATNTLDFGIGPSISWNFLDFGRIRGNVRVQDARFEQALEAYQQAVLQAASEVDSAALVFAKSGEEADILAQSEQAAARSLALAQIRFREGLSDFQRVLDAQAALLRQQDRAITNRGDHAASLVALYKAVGGGWDDASNQPLVDEASRARMRTRINWGPLLDGPTPEANVEPKP
jgi:NodT family efflux transporter outer membrane factor (OMF) lipoprotein